MRFDVQLLWRAERDVDHIVTWLFERSPQGAAAWHQVWKNTVKTLGSSADAHGLAPENADHALEIRQIHVSQPPWKGLPRALHNP